MMKKLILCVNFLLISWSALSMESNTDLGAPTVGYQAIKIDGYKEQSPKEIRVKSPVPAPVVPRSLNQVHNQPDSCCLRHAKELCVTTAVTLIGGAIGIYFIANN